MFNICAADDHTIVYAAGNFVGVFDTNGGGSSFRKCAGNGGIGHIAVSFSFSPSAEAVVNGFPDCRRKITFSATWRSARTATATTTVR